MIEHTAYVDRAVDKTIQLTIFFAVFSVVSLQSKYIARAICGTVVLLLNHVSTMSCTSCVEVTINQSNRVSTPAIRLFSSSFDLNKSPPARFQTRYS